MTTMSKKLQVGRWYWIQGMGPMLLETVFPGGVSQMLTTSRFHYWAGPDQFCHPAMTEDAVLGHLDDVILKIGPRKRLSEKLLMLARCQTKPGVTFGDLMDYFCNGPVKRIADDEALFLEVGSFAQHGLNYYPVMRYVELHHHKLQEAG
jgi:hypothetical protein